MLRKQHAEGCEAAQAACFVEGSAASCVPEGCSSQQHATHAVVVLRQQLHATCVRPAAA